MLRWLDVVETLIDAANGEVDWRLVEKEVRIFIENIYPTESTSSSTLILKDRVLAKLKKQVEAKDATPSR
jgi:hypothetical protein